MATKADHPTMTGATTAPARTGTNGDDAAKFGRMVAFGEALPALRRRVDEHVRLDGLPRDKVLAAVVGLLDRTLIRVGNDEYARDNGSFGLTTMLDDHVELRGDRVRFEFVGKAGRAQEVTLRDRPPGGLHARPTVSPPAVTAGGRCLCPCA